MAYIGRVRPTETTATITRNPFTGDGTTVNFILSRAPANEESVFVTIGGVVQQNSAYTISGTTLTFVSAPDNGVEIEARIISDVGVGYLPPENSLEGKHLVPNTITRNKMAAFNLGNSRRQTVLSGRVDSDGYANFISAGAGLSCGINAASAPTVISYAAGYDMLGAVDYVGFINIDTVNYWNSLSANNTSFLFLDRNETTGLLTPYQSLIPPQYGQFYNRTRQALLHFEDTNGATTTTDDYGNAWTITGGSISTASSKIGSSSLALNGTSQYITNTTISSLGSSGWTIEAWVRRTVNGVVHRLFNVAGSSGLGVRAQLGATNVMTLFLSSNNSTDDITAGSSGTATLTNDGLYHHTAVTFDPIAGKYYYYQDGVVDITIISSARIHQAITQFRIGADFGGGSGWSGNIDEFQFSPYCKYPNGTTFTPSATAATVSGDFFSIPEMKMYSATSASLVAGTNPGMTAVQRVCVGEVITGASTVSSVITYALRGQYTSLPFAIATNSSYTRNHYIGVIPLDDDSYVRCIISNGTAGVVGEIIPLPLNNYGAGTFDSRGTWIQGMTRNVAKLFTGVNGVGVAQSGNITEANWMAVIMLDRGW